MPTPTFLANRGLVLQSFKESTWNTSGAATAKWMGIGVPEFVPFRKSQVHDEFRGTLAPGYLFNQLKRGGTWKVGGKLTYEDAVFLGASMFGTVAPTGVGPYTYSYVGGLATNPSLTTFTFEFNQASALSRATGCVANKLTIKGEAEKEMTYDLSGFAGDIDSSWGGSLAALSDRTVEVCIFPSVTFFMDASGGTLGATAFATRLLKYQLDIENMAGPVPSAGQLGPAGWVMSDKWKTSLSLQLLVATDTRNFLNNTLQSPAGALIRTRATSGTKVLTMDYAGVLTDDVKQIGEFNGAQAIDVKLSGYYDSAAGFHTNMTVVNNVAAVP